MHVEESHAKRVGRLTHRIALRLGLAPDVCDLYARAAELHDVGKSAIATAILDKPGPLSTVEREEVERHTVIGASMLAHQRQDFLQTACVIALTHHERWDGGGYPFGLAKEDIPLASRIVAVADVFDCLRTKRAYKEALSETEARAIVREGSGSHFDPMCVMAFDTTFALRIDPSAVGASVPAGPAAGTRPDQRVLTLSAWERTAQCA